MVLLEKLSVTLVQIMKSLKLNSPTLVNSLKAKLNTKLVIPLLKSKLVTLTGAQVKLLKIKYTLQ